MMIQNDIYFLHCFLYDKKRTAEIVNFGLFILNLLIKEYFIFRSELESAIEKGFSLVQVSVDNGTLFLHKGMINNVNMQ